MNFIPVSRGLIVVFVFALAGCGSKLYQAKVNPPAPPEAWDAEQEYFLDKLEEFCFDRRWDEAPMRFGENRSVVEARPYRLWGKISDDEPQPDLPDRHFHYVCKVIANIPFYKVSRDDYRSIRSSPWWNAQRRALFRQKIEDRFGVLYSAEKPKVDRFDSHMMLLRDGKTVLEIKNFRRNSGTSVRVYRRRAVPAASVESPDEVGFGAERVQAFLGEDETLRSVELIRHDAAQDLLPLSDVVAMGRLSSEQMKTLARERSALSVEEIQALKNQAAYNIERIEHEVQKATFVYKDTLQRRKEEKAFERRLAAQRRASNQAILNQIGAGLMAMGSNSASGGGGTGGSTAISSGSRSGGSYSQAEAEASLYSAQVPWAQIQQQAIEARQQMREQRAVSTRGADNGSGGSPPSAGGSDYTTGNRSVTRGERAPNRSTTSRDFSNRSSTSREPVQVGAVNHSASSNRAETSSSTASGSGASGVDADGGRVYEPMPEVITGKNGSSYTDRDYAVAMARLSAANDISSLCVDKGARAEKPTFNDLREGNVPIRWNLSNPDCERQKNDEWVCSAKVSGTCYREDWMR